MARAQVPDPVPIQAPRRAADAEQYESLLRSLMTLALIAAVAAIAIEPKLEIGIAVAVAGALWAAATYLDFAVETQREQDQIAAAIALAQERIEPRISARTLTRRPPVARFFAGTKTAAAATAVVSMGLKVLSPMASLLAVGEAIYDKI